MSMRHHVDMVRGPTYKALSMVKPFMPFMNMTQRKELIEAKVLSTPSYGLSLYLGQSETVKDRLTAVFMRAYRMIYGKHIPHKTKNEFICRQIKLKTPRQLIVQEGLKFMSKVINTQTPNQISAS